MTDEQRARLAKVIRDTLAFTAPELLEWKLNVAVGDFIDSLDDEDEDEDEREAPIL